MDGERDADKVIAWLQATDGSSMCISPQAICSMLVLRVVDSGFSRACIEPAPLEPMALQKVTLSAKLKRGVRE